MTPVTFRFDDQTVLVTGGATGLGFAIAEVFAAGARIALNDLSAGYIDVEEGGQHLDEAYKTAARSAIPPRTLRGSSGRGAGDPLARIAAGRLREGCCRRCRRWKRRWPSGTATIRSLSVPSFPWPGDTLSR